jgi:hypothetical protein
LKKFEELNEGTMNTPQKQKYPCVYAFLTQELVDKIRRNRKDPIGILPDGYSFYCETPEDLERCKEKYKKGNKYNGETIISIATGKQQYQ